MELGTTSLAPTTRIPSQIRALPLPQAGSLGVVGSGDAFLASQEAGSVPTRGQLLALCRGGCTSPATMAATAASDSAQAHATAQKSQMAMWQSQINRADTLRNHNANLAKIESSLPAKSTISMAATAAADKVQVEQTNRLLQDSAAQAKLERANTLRNFNANLAKIESGLPAKPATFSMAATAAADKVQVEQTHRLLQDSVAQARLERANILAETGARPPAAVAPSTSGDAAGVKSSGTESALGQTVRIGGGLLAVAGGGFQLKQAAEEFQEGKKVDATTSAVSGSLNVLGGAGLALGATTLGPVALAGAAAVTGGRDIVEGVKTGSTEKISVGSVKTAAAVAMGAAPFAAGTIVGAPVGLVLAGGGALAYGAATAFENRGKIGELMGQAYDTVRNKMH